MDEFRKYIARRQQELGLSQNELGEKAGKTGSWLSKFMSNERKDLRMDTFMGLAKALQVSPAKLILAYDDKDPDSHQTVTDPSIIEATKTFLSLMPKEVIVQAIKELSQDKEKDGPLTEAIQRELRKKNG